MPVIALLVFLLIIHYIEYIVWFIAICCFLGVIPHLYRYLESISRLAAFRAEYEELTTRRVLQEAQETQNSQKNFKKRKQARIAARIEQTENRNAFEGLRNRLRAEMKNLMRNFAKWREQSKSEWREILNRLGKNWQS